MSDAIQAVLERYTIGSLGPTIAEEAMARRIVELEAAEKAEEKSHGDTIDERDAMEERVNQIAVALGLDETSREWSSANDVGVRCIEAVELLRFKLARIQEALTPSAETKAAYIGKFHVRLPDTDEDGNECVREINVPWTTVKKIMAEIRDRASLTVLSTPDGMRTNPVAAVRCVEWMDRNLRPGDPVPEVVIEDDGSIGVTLRCGDRSLTVGFDDRADPPHEDQDYMLVGFEPAATVREAITALGLTKTPKRRHEITLTVSGDTLDAVARELEHLAHKVSVMKEPQTTSSVGGGPQSGHCITEHHFDPEQTHDRYVEQIKAWMAQSDASSTENLKAPMVTIHKFPILGAAEGRHGPFALVMPKHAQVVHVGLDGDGVPCLWALLTTEDEYITRWFHCIGTGLPFPRDARRSLGSVTVGSYVWHIYDTAQE